MAQKEIPRAETPVTTTARGFGHVYVASEVDARGLPTLPSDCLRLALRKHYGVTQDPMAVLENMPSQSVFPVGKGRSSSFSNRNPWFSSKARRRETSTKEKLPASVCIDG